MKAVERRADLVADIGQELGLGAAGGLRILLGHIQRFGQAAAVPGGTGCSGRCTMRPSPAKMTLSAAWTTVARMVSRCISSISDQRCAASPAISALMPSSMAWIGSRSGRHPMQKLVQRLLVDAVGARQQGVRFGYETVQFAHALFTELTMC